MALMLAPVPPGATATSRPSRTPVSPASRRRCRVARTSATRLIAGHTLTLDDPLAQRRLDAREVEFWREAGIHYFVPCVSKEGTIAVMALGRKASAEPLSSEDMALLAAVAAQAATALENGRLYRQLRIKADELERMREFSENILESLNDGLAVVNRDDRVVRWNRRLEELYGFRHEDAVGRRSSEIFDPGFLDDAAVGRRDAAEGAAVYRVPLRDAAPAAAAAPRQPGDDAAARFGRGDCRNASWSSRTSRPRVQLEEQLQISEKMASIGLLAAGVAHEVNTPLTGISSFTQMLLQGAEPDDPKTKVLEKIERQTFRAAKIVNGLLNLARPAQVDSGAGDINVVINDVLSLLEHQLRNGGIQVRKELQPVRRSFRASNTSCSRCSSTCSSTRATRCRKGGWLTIVTRSTRDGAVVEVADTGSGIPRRAAVADLRSVLHDQGDRQGHRPRPVDHLRHRAGARRHDHLRQRRRAGHAVRPVAAAGAGRPRDRARCAGRSRPVPDQVRWP